MLKKTLPEYGMHHVGYVVKDREDAIRSFADSCGIDQCKRISFKAGRAWLLGEESSAAYEMKIAMLTLSDRETAIEIIEPLSPGPHLDFVQLTGGGIHHIGFDVGDEYDSWKQKLLNGGAKALFESETEDEIVGYRRCLYVKLPSGDVIEIKETPYFR